ncbi:MAG: lipopolysaccharide biosynthesis protein [Solirubrobacterales bacterium]
MIARPRTLLNGGGSGGGLAKSGAQTFATMGVFLGLSLITGVISSRLLGPSGRGEVAAIITLGQTIGWAISFGCFQAVVTRNARDPEHAQANTGTWIVIALPMGVVGIVVGELLVGPLFRAQSDTAVTLARLWVLLVPLMPISEALSGAIVAAHDFAAANALKLLQQIITVVAYVLLWLIGEFTVETVLLTQLVVITTYLLLLILRTRRRVGFARPRMALARSGLSYGLRAQASNIGGQLNARLDLLIMPAFLAATQVGLYAVAVSVASLIVSFAGSLAMIVLPVSATGGARSAKQFAQMFHATVIAGLVFALPVALLAPVLLELVYSAPFRAAGGALRLLVPGAVLLAMANIVVSGLLGQHRPATAGASQLPGLVVTVVGLLLFLRSGGIEAAALISTITYAISLVVASILFVRRWEYGWRELYDLRPTFTLVLERVAELIARRRRRRAPETAAKEA